MGFVYFSTGRRPCPSGAAMKASFVRVPILSISTSPCSVKYNVSLPRTLISRVSNCMSLDSPSHPPVCSHLILLVAFSFFVIEMSSIRRIRKDFKQTYQRRFCRETRQPWFEIIRLKYISTRVCRKLCLSRSENTMQSDVPLFPEHPFEYSLPMRQTISSSVEDMHLNAERTQLYF